jgi:pyruvate formate lyase activating enzyme
MMKPSLIFDIKGNALDDGPGIRSVIFFKGCPLSCAWCHNPESKRVYAELSFDAQKCIVCNNCIGECPNDALSRDNQYFVNRKKCTRCFACVDKCPTGALARIGREFTKTEIIEKVVKYKPFYDVSGGGVTFSGGEPTMHMQFLSDLLVLSKSHGIHTLIETCGFFNMEEFKILVLPYTDIIYMDIKIFNREKHRRYCGVHNEVILENFIRLHELSRRGGFRIIPRIPIIPQITDTKENLASIASFLHDHQVKDVLLLPNNPIWHEKCGQMGMKSHDRGKSPSPQRQWISKEDMDAHRNIFGVLRS